MSASDTALLFGYVLAIPFTVFVPGFLRLWRRREVEVFAVAQVGAAVIAAAWLAKGDAVAAAVNAAWLVGLSVAWVLEGRKRRSVRDRDRARLAREPLGDQAEPAVEA